jgi:demethylmenaquinone methyltransferase / 2-methoxy-6-polyprenyl-1,4-benzoquinol methylase
MTHERPGGGRRRRTGLEAPARTVTHALFAGRRSAPGPRRVGAFLPDEELHRMFETIGGTYDSQNHLLSLGRDVWWRKLLTERVKALPGQTVADMATGTGDVAVAVARRWAGVRVIGIDYSERMLAVARRKLAALPEGVRERITLRHGDIRSSGLPDGCAEVLTNTFALRNIPDRGPVLREFHRILKPGGRLYIMEPGIPAGPVAGLVYRVYFNRVMPFLGNLLSRTDYAYSYLRHSIEGFPAPGEFLSELREAGFTRARVTPLSYGIAVLYAAVRGGEGG